MYEALGFSELSPNCAPFRAFNLLGIVTLASAVVYRDLTFSHFRRRSLKFITDFKRIILFARWNANAPFNNWAKQHFAFVYF